MKTVKKQIQKYIRRNDKELHKLISQTIKRNQRIHISAPTGTGKTEFIMETVKRFIGTHQILIIVPQIALMNQLQHDLKQLNIKTFQYNAGTKLKFRAEDLDHPVISTYDSAHQLINKSFTDLDGITAKDFKLLDPKTTIVIMDESHVLITDGKANYDRSIREIINANVPIIGFSATPSSWVINDLLDIDVSVEITSEAIPQKVVIPILIRNNTAATLAKHIVDEKFKKVVIYTPNIGTQNKLKDEVDKLSKTINIVILNRPEKMKRAKAKWNKMVKTSKIPEGVNILMMNKVAQAGINIKDNDIDAVFLVGQFDPYGFIQYMGRTRNYKGKYFYVYNNYGEQFDPEEETPAEYMKDKMIRSTIATSQLMIDNISNHNKLDKESLVKTFGDKYDLYQGDIVLNKCLAAKTEYDGYGKLHGLCTIQIVEEMNSGIEVDYYDDIDPVISASAKNRKTEVKQNIIKLVSQMHISIIQLTSFMRYDKLNWNYISYLIESSKSSRAKSITTHTPYFSNHNQEKLLLLSTKAKEAGIGVARIIAAAYAFHRDHNEESIRTILSSKTKNRDVVNALKVKLYFIQNSSNVRAVDKVLDSIERYIGHMYQKPQWIDAIMKSVGRISGSNEFAEMIYSLFLIFIQHQVTVDGSLIKVKKLNKVIRSYDEYVNEIGIDYFPDSP
ncbi:MAG: DEAD/DEAH box helicase family protein [Bacteroidota bacterium]